MKKSISLIYLSFIFSQFSFAQDAADLIHKMLQAESKIRTLEVTMIMNERVDSRMKEKKGDFKISYSPFKLYMKQEYPQKGMELLYVENKNNNKAWVNTNSIPWVTLSINPNSKTMRRGYHHSIFNSGYRYFSDIVQHLVITNGSKINEVISYNGIKTIKGYPCHQVVYNSPDFKYFDYTVREELSLAQLSERFYVNDYMLIDKNPGLVDFDEVKTGRALKIPSDYGKKVIINLDIKNNLPRSIHVYDEKGLYQEYYYLNITINPAFSPKDFDPNNEKYNF